MKRHVLRFEQASFLVVVMLTAFLMISCIPRNPNTPPVADFKLVESSATELRQLHFDASTSTDKEDSTDKLIARWDFNGDGVWEIDYSANKKANEVVSHSYNVAGTTTVIVEVKDSKGLTSRREKEIQINLAPPESLYLGSASGQEITIIWDDISTSEDSYNVSLNDNPLEQLPANTEEYTFELDTSATQTISVYCTKGTMKSNKTELVMGMNLSESTTVFEEVSITLPASHVGKKVTIAVTEPSEQLPEGCNVESTAYDINVEGLTDEATESPVEVTFTSEFVESEENNNLIILHYDDYLGEWIPAYTVFQNGKYKTFTTHFSTYVLTSVETSSEILTKRVESYSVQKYGLNFTNSPGKVLDAGKLLGVADFTSQEGVCYGMVMTSLGLFNMGLGFADPIFNFGGDLEPRLAWKSVRGYYITCTPIAEFVEIKQEDGPGLISCVERLIDRTFTDNITNANNTYLLLAEGIPVVLSLGSYVQDVGDEDHDGDTTDIIRRGHAVLAYGVKVEGSSVYVFSIYDPNRPQVNSELMINNGKVVGYYSDYSEMLCIGVDSRTGPGRTTLLTENLDKSYSPWFKDVYYYINDNSIKLSWWNHCRPDRSLPSSQYIKRSEGGNFSNISTINISVKNYADTSIEVNKEYKYKVSRSDGKETPEVSIFTRYYDVVPETGSKVNKKGFTVTFPQLPSGNIIVIALYLKEGFWEYLTRNNGFSNSSDFTEDDCNKLFRNSDSATIRFVAYNNDYDRTYAVRDVTYYLTDNTPPTVTKVSGPDGEISESSSTFTWTGSDSDGTITKYEYRKDGGSWVSNGTSTSYTWSDYLKGDHKFEVRAQDDKGEYSNIIVWEFTYQKENEPPTVTKVSGPSGTISQSSSTFTWTGSDSDGTITKYEYRKDGGNWVSNGTSTSYTWSDYSKGDHKFEVRAQDNKGEYSNIIVWEFTYQKENEPPTVTKVSGPSEVVSESSSTFTWTGSDSDGTITKYEYRKDGGNWVSNGTSTSYTWSDYSKGDHKFEVRAQDNDGEYSNVVKWEFEYSFHEEAPTITWQKFFGGSGSEGAYSVQQTNDGGYVVFGDTRSDDGDVTGNNGGQDFWVVKVNSSGSIKWQKCLGGSDNEDSSSSCVDADGEASIQQTSDGGYVVVGSTDSNDGDVSGNHGKTDFWVVKLNSTGEILWQKCLGGSSFDFGHSIQQTSDGGYVVVGLTDSNDGDVSGNHGSSDAWIVKLNSIGSIEWQKCLGGSGYEQATSIEQTSEGGYIVVGLTTSNDGDVSGNHEDAWVVKLNSTGSILWQKCLGEYNCVYLAFSIEQTSDNGYVVAGFRASNEAEEVSGILIKLDNSGSINWQMCFDKSGYDNILYSVKQTSDNGYIVAGASLNHEENFDFWLLKLD